MNETKQHILTTSLMLFLQKSYKDVTMKEIVEKTGLSKGAFYHYFTSKEELFKEIATLFFTSGAINYTLFPKDSLKGFISFYTDYISETFVKLNQMFGAERNEKISINFFFIMFEAISRFPEFLKFERDQHEKDMLAWSEIIKFAKKEKEIISESSEEEIANMFLFTTDGVFIRFVNSDQKNSFASELQKAFDVIYNNLKS